MTTRFERIIGAYNSAVANNSNANGVDILNVLPEIYAAIPDTSAREIVAALRWAAATSAREAEALEQWSQTRRVGEDRSRVD